MSSCRWTPSATGRGRRHHEELKDFKTDTIGQPVDPAAVAADHAAGIPFEDIHAKAMRGAYVPQQAARRRFAAGAMRTRRFGEAAA